MTDSIDIHTIADFKRDDSIGGEFVDAWLSVFRRSPGAEDLADFPLTELQRLVANDPGSRTVSGPNLVVAGPTSAGKTLTAEMMMARLLTAARPPYGCIYAVPTRALATEKWDRFKSVFGEEHVYVSSGDYQDQDAYILHRRFRIAVVVYEKLYGWLLQRDARNAILTNLGLLIIDELQMLGDTQRGPRLELLLTFIRQLKAEGSKLRIVGLGPDRDALSPIADWLDARLAATDEEKRPVPLAEGYICPHRPVNLVKLDPRLEPDKVYVPAVSGTTREAMLIDLVSGLLRRDGRAGEVGRGKRLLVYSPTKDGAERMARVLAEALGTRQEIDHPTAQSFDALERTHATERLRKTVLAGVGFHHGDLLFEERSIVESLFRGDSSATCLDVVVCTPTLAMGVNLPADYMLFPSSESYKPKDWDARTNLPTPLTPLEYRNFAGRAGRFRPNAPPDHHGVALFISDRTDEETWREIAEPIILGRVTPIASEMHRWPFGIETLALAAADSVSGLTHAVAFHEGVFNVFQSTYAAKSGAQLVDGGISVPLADGVIPKLEALAARHVELITADFAVAKTGNVVARAGIHILTYEALKSIAERAEKEDILGQPLVILESLALVPEIVKLYPTSLPESAKEQMVVTRALRQFLRELQNAGHTLGPRAATMISQTHVPDRITLEGLMRVAAVWLFIEGRTAEEIGSQPMLPRLRYGACNLLGDQLHWLVSTLPNLWDALGLSNDVDENRATDLRWAMGRLERRLRFGVPNELVSIAQLRVKGLHRENMMEIWKSVAAYRNQDRGWGHPVEILDVPAKAIGRWRNLVRTLQRAIIGHAWSDDPREPWQKQIDVARMASDSEGIRYVDREWPELLRALWTVEDNVRLVSKLALALTLKPLKLNVKEQERPAGGKNYFVFYNGRWILLAVVGNGAKALWDDIRALSAGTGPNGKAVDGVLVLANGIFDDNAGEARVFGRSIRVVTREALGHMIVQALLAPEDEGSEESDRTRPRSVSQVVRNWLCAESAGVLTSAAEADKALKSNGLDEWLRESRSMQGRAGEIDAHVALADVRDRSLRQQKLQILRTEVERLDLSHRNESLESDIADFSATLIEEFLKQVERIDTDPSEVVAFVRTSLEELTKHVLNDHGEHAKGTLEAMLTAVGAKTLMPLNWIQSANTLRQRSNPAHHSATAPDPRGRFPTQSYSFAEAWELLSVDVRLWTEYLKRRPDTPLQNLEKV